MVVFASCMGGVGKHGWWQKKHGDEEMQVPLSPSGPRELCRNFETAVLVVRTGYRVSCLSVLALHLLRSNGKGLMTKLLASLMGAIVSKIVVACCLIGFGWSSAEIKKLRYCLYAKATEHCI